MSDKDASNKGANIPKGLYDAMLARAVGLHEQEKFQRAVVMLEQLLTDNPTDVDVLKLHGSCLQLSSRQDEAERSYRKVLELSPNEPDVLTNLGEILISRMDYENALVLLKKAIDLDPDYQNPSSQRARALAMELLEELG